MKNCIYTMDVGGTAVKTAVFNSSGHIVFENTFPSCAVAGGEALMEKLLINAEKDITGFEIKAAGICSAGQIDPERGVVVYATDNIPGWTGMDIKGHFERRLAIPVIVENDVNAAAAGEGCYGAGKGFSDFLCLTYGTGIGGAIVINGGIYRGSGFLAGEFGHMITGVGGRCTCGGTGCYETSASTTALAGGVLSATGKIMNGREIFALIDDETVRKCVNEWLDNVISGMISLVYIFNPSLFILGGGVMEQPYAIDYIRSNLYERLMPSFRKFEVSSASLGNKAGLYGVFSIAARNT